MGWLRRQWWYATLPRNLPPATHDSSRTDLRPEEQENAREALARFDSPDQQVRDEAWSKLPDGRALMPLLLDAYPRTRRMEARISMMYEATFFARVSEAAFQLGILGCRDRSKHVRDRACGVLAYSLRRDALPALRPLLRDPDPFTRSAAENAIRAIKRQSHSLYWGGSPGDTVWVVNRGDDPWLPTVGRDIDA
jgi:hypothetical protein